METVSIDHNNYVEIADGTYWVGFSDKTAGFHCNPYLIADGGEAVLIDGGSRNDFSTVMLKIMRAGIDPKRIKTLIYQHYDPDLCGNLPHLEALIGRGDLRIISHKLNNYFINYYSTKTRKECIEDMDFNFRFASGRELKFIRTPYAHSPGSFVTYDVKTKVLFSGDIFGSYDDDWALYTKISDKCAGCETAGACPESGKACHITGICNFHRDNMSSAAALRFAIKQIGGLDISIIAPQHGSLLHTRESRQIAIERLGSLTDVGIDQYFECAVNAREG